MANGNSQTPTDLNIGEKPGGKHRIIQPTIHRPLPARLRGPFSSAEYNNFTDAAHHDIVNLASAVNTNSNRIERALRQVHSENDYLRRRIEVLQQEVTYRQFQEASASQKVSQYFDLHNSSYILHEPTLDSSKRASYNARFGELALPANAVENKLFVFSLRTGNVVLPSDLIVNVTNIFDKLEGAGLIDYEYGGISNEGVPLNACNGVNQSIWMRSVTFPMSTETEEVECQMTIVVPANISQQTNIIDVLPFPEGSVDITEVSTAVGLSSAFVMLESFTEHKNATAKRYRFNPRAVEQIRIKLKSRNWTEVNGKKVFYYGLQEINAKLVDYEKSFIPGGTFGQNITGIVQMDAVSGFNFRKLYSIDTAPAFLTEDPELRNVRLVLSSTPDFAGTVWDSTQNPLPQNLGGLGFDISPSPTLYAILEMQFVKQVSGLSSPYFVGNSPWVNGIGLTYTT